MAFTSDLDVPTLVSVAGSHAQFETIDLFTDGNCRTGRALAQTIIQFSGVTRNVDIPVSAGLLADGEGYHEALTAYREGDVTSIVRAFANAALRAVSHTRQLAEEIEAAQHS